MSIADRINEQYNNLLGGNKNDKTETTIKQDFSIADRINEQYNNLLGKKTIQQISPQTTVVKEEPQYSFLNKSTSSIGKTSPFTSITDSIVSGKQEKPLQLGSIKLETRPIEYTVEAMKGFVSSVLSSPQWFMPLIKENAEKIQSENRVVSNIRSLISFPSINSIFTNELAKNKKLSQDVINFSNNVIKKNIEFIEKSNLIPNKDDKIKQVFFELGSGTASIGTALGLTYITKQPHLAGMLFGAMAKGRTYEEARKSGLTPTDAGDISTLAGITEGALEYLGDLLFFKKFGGRFANTIRRGLIEAFEETSQEIGGNFWAKIGYDPKRKLFDNAIKAGIYGFVLGVPFGVIFPETFDFRNVKKDLIKSGLTENEANFVIEKTVEEARKIAEEKITPELPKIQEETISEIDKNIKKQSNAELSTGYNIIKNNLIPQVSRYNQEAGRILSNIDFSGINSLTGLKMKMLNALPPELKTKAIVDSIDSWFRSAEQAVDFIKSEKKSEKTNIQVSKNKKSLIKKPSVEVKQVSQQAETKIPKELEPSGQQLQEVSIPTSPEIKTEPEVKPEVKQGIKSAGEIGEKMLGGRVHPVKDIKQQKQNWFASKLESVFPKLKAKKIEQEIGREVVQEMPNDLSGIETLFNFILPKRTLFSRNYLASEMVAKSIKTVLIYKEQLKTFNNYFKSLNKKYNFDKKQKEQFADYIELGLSDEKVETLPEPYKSAIKEYRQLSELIIELLDDVGVDVSKFRFDITNYLHHYFSGTHEVFSPSKNTRLFFGSYKDAIDFVSNYIKQYPKSDVVVRKRTIDIKPTTTQLSTKGFRKLLLQLSNILSISPKEVIQNNLLKGVAGVEKKRVFIGALLPRKVNLSGYLKDPFAVQKILLSKVLKKKYVEGLTKELRRDLNKLPRGYREEMKNYIKAIETEGIIDPSLYKIQKGVGKIKTFQASTKLGWGLRQIGVNRIQHFTFSLADVGIKYYVNGIRFSKTAEGKELIKKSNITGSPAKYDAGNFEVNNDVKFYHPLFGFSKSEVAVRGETLCMYYLYAKDRFILEIQNKTRKKFGLQPYKKAEDLWLDYAIREVAGSMGMYNYTDFPKIMLLPVGKLTLQFQFLRLIWLDKAFRTTLGLPTAGTEIFFKAQPRSAKENIKRAWIFWFNTFLTTGVRLFSKLLLKILGTELGLMFAYFIVKHPKIASGISALFGVDLSSSFSTEPFGVIEQNSLFDSLGVNAADLKKAYTAIQKYREKNWKAGTNILLTVAPNIARVAEAIFFMEDGIKQNWWTDVPQAKFSIPERIVYGLGLTPLKLTKARDMSAFISLLNSSKELTNKQIRNAINKEKDINKAISLAVEWNTHFLKMYDLIIQRTEEITDKKITDDNKIKLLKKYLIEAKEFRNLGITSVTDEMLKTFGVEKMLDIKQ